MRIEEELFNKWMQLNVLNIKKIELGNAKTIKRIIN